MPGDVKRLRIFVASPGDVAEERKVLAEVVDHLRTHVAAPYGLDLELVRWEIHVRPGARQRGHKGVKSALDSSGWLK